MITGIMIKYFDDLYSDYVYSDYLYYYNYCQHVIHYDIICYNISHDIT